MTIQSAMLDMTMVFADFLRSRRRNLLSAQDLGALEEAVADLRTLPARKTFISRDQNVSMSTYLIEGMMCRYMDDRQGEMQLVAVHDFVHVECRHRLAIIAREDDGAQQEHEQADPAGDGKTQRQQLIEQFLADDVQQHFRRPPSAYVTS